MWVSLLLPADKILVKRTVMSHIKTDALFLLQKCLSYLESVPFPCTLGCRYTCGCSLPWRTKKFLIYAHKQLSLWLQFSFSILLCITKSVIKTALYSSAITYLKMGQCCHTNLEKHNTMQLLLEWLRAEPNPHAIPFPSHNDHHITAKPTRISTSHFMHEYTLRSHSHHRHWSKSFKTNCQAYQNSVLCMLVWRTLTKVVWHYLFWIYYISS
jgi:hypothetical protein